MAKNALNIAGNAIVDVSAVTIGVPLALATTAITTVAGLGQFAFTGNSTILKNEAKIIGV